MPLHQIAQRRRQFLKSISACGAAAVFAGAALDCPAQSESPEPDHDPDFFALLSDTHIPSSPEVTARGVNMTENLKSVVNQIGALAKRPSNLMVNGDCAYLKGLPADYANLAECLLPLDSLGIHLHVTMGNHDDRKPLLEGLSGKLAGEKTKPVVEGKHISVIESKHANWFLLDSLMKVNVVTGEIGAEQLRWLGAELDKRSDKPALVMTHHNPQFTPPQGGSPWSGVSDTEALFQVLDAREHVKALFFGHSHNWSISRRERIHLVNLLPVAYVFSQGKPNGWVDARLMPKGMRLTLKTLDQSHPNAGEVVDLDWA